MASNTTHNAVAREILRRIDLHPRSGLPSFTIATRKQDQDAVLALSALYVYAVYGCSNYYTYDGSINVAISREDAMQFMGESLIQGCQGHEQLAALLDNRCSITDSVHVASC